MSRQVPLFSEWREKGDEFVKILRRAANAEGLTSVAQELGLVDRGASEEELSSAVSRLSHAFAGHKQTAIHAWWVPYLVTIALNDEANTYLLACREEQDPEAEDERDAWREAADETLGDEVVALLRTKVKDKLRAKARRRAKGQ